MVNKKWNVSQKMAKGVNKEFVHKFNGGYLSFLSTISAAKVIGSHVSDTGGA